MNGHRPVEFINIIIRAPCNTHLKCLEYLADLENQVLAFTKKLSLRVAYNKCIYCVLREDKVFGESLYL